MKHTWYISRVKLMSHMPKKNNYTNIFISHTSINWPPSRPHQNALSHLDKLPSLFLAVIPEAIVDPEAQQLQRWLGAKEVMGRHVEVVQEAQQALPTRWHKLSFGSLLDAALHDGLDVIGGGLDSDGDTEIQKRWNVWNNLNNVTVKFGNESDHNVNRKKYISVWMWVHLCICAGD